MHTFPLAVLKVQNYQTVEENTTLVPFHDDTVIAYKCYNTLRVSLKFLLYGRPNIVTIAIDGQPSVFLGLI